MIFSHAIRPDELGRHGHAVECVIALKVAPGSARGENQTARPGAYDESSVFFGMSESDMACSFLRQAMGHRLVLLT